MSFSKASGPALQPPALLSADNSGSFFEGKTAGKWSWTLTCKWSGWEWVELHVRYPIWFQSLNKNNFIYPPLCFNSLRLSYSGKWFYANTYVICVKSALKVIQGFWPAPVVESGTVQHLTPDLKDSRFVVGCEFSLYVYHLEVFEV